MSPLIMNPSRLRYRCVDFHPKSVAEEDFDLHDLCPDDVDIQHAFGGR